MSTPDSATPTPQEFAALREQLAQSQAQMQHLLYAVSHDLRAPLRHVTSFSRLLQDEVGAQLDEEARGFLTHVVDSAQRMGLMLDALLALSRVGGATLQRQNLCLADVVHEAQQEVLRRTGDRQALWELDSTLAQTWVHADATLLRLALVELMDNALKFSAAAQPCAHIQLCLERDAVHWRLLLRDNGVGFAPEQAPRLGLPFVRLHSAQQFAGLGMGLALARTALERMGATLELVSGGLAGGCEVRMVVPAAVPEQ